MTSYIDQFEKRYKHRNTQKIKHKNTIIIVVIVIVVFSATPRFCYTSMTSVRLSVHLSAYNVGGL